jgi:hypothetical protein
MQQETSNILISGLMGILGGLITLPISTILQWALKRDEIGYKSKHDEINKRNELLLAHKLEMKKIQLSSKNKEVTEIPQQLINRLEEIEERLNILYRRQDHE